MSSKFEEMGSGSNVSISVARHLLVIKDLIVHGL